MKIQKIYRETRSMGDQVILKSGHDNANLVITNGKVTLSDSQFNLVADGFIQEMNTSYNGSPFNLQLTVLVYQYNDDNESYITYRQELWFIKFYC